MIPKRRPRVPGLIFSGLSGVIFAVVGIVALTGQLAPPPIVAEFAPVLPKGLSQAARDFGIGGQVPGGAGAAPAPSPSPAPVSTGPTITVPAIRPCIGGRQIEDPQSPPCVPYWQGDNGGSTAKGVTGDSITVAIGDAAGPTWDPKIIQDYQNFFNRRFEFYNRQLHLVPYTPAATPATAVQMTNDAAKVNEMNAFAALGYSEQDGRQYVYYDALAQQYHIVGVTDGLLGLPRADEAHLAGHAPYEWEYTPSSDRMFSGYGQFLCNTLAHKAPQYGGPFSWLPSERTFGIIVDTGYTDTPPFDITPLVNTLQGCGVKPVIEQYDQSATNTLIVDLETKHVTSVMYTGSGSLLALRLMAEAASQGYNPEWLVWDLGYQASDVQAADYPKGQSNHVLGLQVFSKSLRPEDMPFWWAAKEVDPAASPAGDAYMRLYEMLLLLASGIQMAGPHLTPYTFQAGLFRTQFPNPGAGAAPYYQGTVGFPGVHSMVQDMTMVWLSQTDTSPWTGNPPAFCYVDAGVRYGLGQWPRRDERFFQGACR